MNFRRFLITTITFLSGLYFFLEFLLPEELFGYKFGRYHEQIMLGVRVVGSMTFGLGIINIAQVHGSRVLRLQKSWENSLALIFGFVLMLGVGMAQFAGNLKNNHSVEELEHLKDFIRVVEEDRLAEKLVLTTITPVPAHSRIQTILPVLDRHQKRWQNLGSGSETELKSEQLTPVIEGLSSSKIQTQALVDAYLAISHKQAVEDLDQTIERLLTSVKNVAQMERELSEVVEKNSLSSKLSQFLYDGFFVSLGSAMFSLLAFYIAGAAYRAFRVRSLEATILMVTATLMILGQIPHGQMYISEKLPLIRVWLLKTINTPGNRAIYFGSAIAGLAMAVRMWLSLERSPLDSQNEEA